MLLIAAIACSCGPKTAPKLLSPLPSGLEIDALTDCTVPAKFTSDDFRWMGGNLTMKVFSEDLYDAVEVLQLAPGDTRRSSLSISSGVTGTSPSLKDFISSLDTAGSSTAGNSNPG